MTGRADRFRAALSELEQQRAEYVNQIKDLDDLIVGIKRQIQSLEGVHGAPAPGNPAGYSFGLSPQPSPTDFKNISVRWGVLKFFGDRSRGFHATSSEIAKTLEAGGMESSGQRFIGNVSAVISTMKAKGEIEGEGNYQLTDMGRQTWEGISRSPKYLSRLVSTSPLLPS